jgi:hypothetical protein
MGPSWEKLNITARRYIGIQIIVNIILVAVVVVDQALNL